MKQTALIVFAAIIALALGIAVRHFTFTPGRSVSEPLPAFTLADLSGREHAITEWQGKVMVINFWATWCPSCLKEIPGFIAMQARYGNKGLQMIGIALENKETVESYAADIKINYPLLLGGDQGIVLSRQLGNRVDAIPFTLIVDRHNQIIHQHFGEISPEDLTEIIVPLLNEQP